MSKILIVGKADSIHLAKWLERFKNKGLDFWVFPIDPRNGVHPELRILLTGSYKSTFRLLNQSEKSILWEMRNFSGYLPHHLRKIISYGRTFLRSLTLRKTLNQAFDFEYIHIHEMQSAGYAYVLASNPNVTAKNVIVSNWGSDINFFQSFRFHRFMVRKLLERTDYYIAECHRDFELALKLGYTGKFIQPLPTSFTFKKVYSNEALKISIEQRNQISVKCYGGQIGLGKSSIDVIRNFLSENDECAVLLFSVTRDLHKDAQKLIRDFPQRVRVWNITEQHPHADLMREFLQTRIFVGFSQSDGLSTSLLEAINCGAFGIQSGTSCAIELEDSGLIMEIVSTDANDLLHMLRKVWNTTNELTSAVVSNMQTLEKFFNQELIFSRVERLYDEH